jgi:hypothetical protein
MSDREAEGMYAECVVGFSVEYSYARRPVSSAIAQAMTGTANRVAVGGLPPDLQIQEPSAEGMHGAASLNWFLAEDNSAELMSLP